MTVHLWRPFALLGLFLFTPTSLACGCCCWLLCCGTIPAFSGAVVMVGVLLPTAFNVISITIVVITAFLASPSSSTAIIFITTGVPMLWPVQPCAFGAAFVVCLAVYAVGRSIRVISVVGASHDHRGRVSRSSASAGPGTTASAPDSALVGRWRGQIWLQGSGNRDGQLLVDCIQEAAQCFMTVVLLVTLAKIVVSVRDCSTLWVQRSAVAVLTANEGFVRHSWRCTVVGENDDTLRASNTQCSVSVSVRGTQRHCGRHTLDLAVTAPGHERPLRKLLDGGELACWQTHTL